MPVVSHSYHYSIQQINLARLATMVVPERIQVLLTYGYVFDEIYRTHSATPELSEDQARHGDHISAPSQRP